MALDALFKIIDGKGKPLDSERCLSTQSPKDVKLTMLMVQYRGNQNQYFANKLRKLNNVQVVFTTRKLESVYHHWSQHFLMTSSEEWFINCHVVDALPPMSDKLFDV